MICSIQSPHSDDSGFCQITKKVILSFLSFFESIIPHRKQDKIFRRGFFSLVVMVKYRATREGFSTVGYRMSVLESAKAHAKNTNSMSGIFNKIPRLF